MTSFEEMALSDRELMVAVQMQLNALKSQLAKNTEKVASHDDSILLLNNSVDRQQKELSQMTQVLSELHGENRAKFEAIQTTLKSQGETMAASWDSVGQRLDRLGSLKHWVGWTFAILSTSGVFTIVSSVMSHWH